MIRDEDIRGSGYDSVEPFDRDADAGGFQNQPRPRARAAVCEIAAPVDQAGDKRGGAEADGINRDRGDEIENGPPPMKGGNAQFTRDNVPFSARIPLHMKEPRLWNERKRPTTRRNCWTSFTSTSTATSAA